MDFGNAFFITKKVITALVTPPGIIIAVLLIAAVLFRKKARWFCLGAAAFLYLLSIEPAKDLFLSPLENAYPLPLVRQIQEAEVYVVLGGGIAEQAPDPNGKGALTAESLERTTAAYRLYRLVPKPIILTGGKTHQRYSEAELAADLLVAFGVPKDKAVFDPRGRDVDTEMNARLVHRIATQLKAERIVLITNPFHMRRSVMLFRRYFNNLTPFPAGYKISGAKYRYKSWLPDSYNMHCVSMALKEYLGILYYSIKRSP